MIKKKFSDRVRSFWRRGSSDQHLRGSYVKSRRMSKSRFSVERLEPRIALDAAGVQRPTLERSHDIYLSNVGPSPIVFGKSDISITTDSFVVTSVAHGAVEKWTQADGWVDVSTKPTTSNPRELLKLLQRRVFSKGDRLRWIPAVQDLSTDIATQAAFTSRAKAFEVHDWGPKTEESTDPTTRPEPVENFAVTQTVDGNFTATWGGVPADPTIIRAEYGVASGSDAGSHDGWGMMRPDSGRFEASDLVWHEGLQRFFAVADDGGYLATFTYDGTTVTEIGGPGDYKVDRYWKVDVGGLLTDSTVSSSDKAKLQEMHIDQSTSFEGLTFKKSSDATESSKIIYIGVESEWDEENSGPKIGNKIIEFNFSEAFDVNGDWVFGEGEQPGKITQVFDLGYKHDNKDKGGKDAPMPVHGDVSFAAGLEALTFVPNEVNGTEGLFYAGRQKDGKVYKLNLNQSTTGIVGAVERIGDFTFDSVKNPGYPDLGALQYVEVGGSQYVLALFGEGPKTTQDKTEDSRSGGAVNPDAVRIALATLDGHVTQTWDQEGTWNEFDTDSDDWMTGLRGPEGISYFEIGGVPHLALAQDPGGSQRDQGTNYDPVNGFSPTDGGRIGQVKFFSGFDLDAPQVTSTLKVGNQLTIPGIKGSSYQIPQNQVTAQQGLLSGPSAILGSSLGTSTADVTLHTTALHADGVTTEKTTATLGTSFYQDKLTIVIRHGEDDGNISRPDDWEVNEEKKQNISINTLNDSLEAVDVSVDEKFGAKDSFTLKSEGVKQANSFAVVLPQLVDDLGYRPISRVMVDSFRRPDDVVGTSNPLNTIMPFIFTQANAGNKIDVDLVVLKNGGQDYDAWVDIDSDLKDRRLSPLEGDGSVVIVSTRQGLFDPDKEKLLENAIIGQLNELYGLNGKNVLVNDEMVPYLKTKSWKHTDKRYHTVKDSVFNKNKDQVADPQKGTTIYVYGDLDRNPENGFEVQVYTQNADDQTYHEGHESWG